MRISDWSSDVCSSDLQVSTAISDYEIDSYAVFGQATLHLGEKFEVTLGGRYTRDEKRAVQQGLHTRTGVPLVAVPFAVDNSATYESFDPHVVSTYKFSPDASIYASFSTGFQTGRSEERRVGNEYDSTCK